jgi:hypothetical protein
MFVIGLNNIYPTQEIEIRVEIAHASPYMTDIDCVALERKSTLVQHIIIDH